MRAFFIRPFRLPRSARHERGEGWGEGQLNPAQCQLCASSPRPSPPSDGGEGGKLKSIVALHSFLGGAQ